MSDRERWRKLRRAPDYKISSLVRIKGPGEPLTPFPDKDGYLYVSIHDELVQVSHLMLETFDRPRPYGQEACHGDAGNQVNLLTNLRWDTRRANGRDKTRGRKARSEVETNPYVPGEPATGEVQ